MPVVVCNVRNTSRMLGIFDVYQPHVARAMKQTIRCARIFFADYAVGDFYKRVTQVFRFGYLGTKLVCQQLACSAQKQ